MSDFIDKFCEDIKRNRVYYGNILLTSLKIIHSQNKAIRNALEDPDLPQKAKAHLSDAYNECNMIAKIIMEELPHPKT